MKNHAENNNWHVDTDKLQELCNKISLLEYAEQTCEFKKRGSNYFCSCPKHSDSDPSLCISPDVNLFYCFSCLRKGNLINWLMEYEDLSFQDAVQKVINLTGEDINKYYIPESLKFYKTLNNLQKEKSNISVDRYILDIEKDYNQKFKDEIPQEWLDEGISADEMKKYEIRIDPMSNRIVYPVRDADFNMIGVKGRTRFSNYKTLGIMKYMNYHRIGVLNYFTAMMQAIDSVKETGEIIILEGIKSVMKIDQWGFHNAVSAETSTLNEYQIELLIRMQIRNVVIAFDKDVTMKKVQSCCGLLKKFTNVSVVIDKWNLLKEKESPCDEGESVWRTLYERRVRI